MSLSHRDRQRESDRERERANEIRNSSEIEVIDRMKHGQFPPKWHKTNAYFSCCCCSGD